MSQPLAILVKDVATLLKRTSKRVVFAESCTAGLVAASLARVPGISDQLCGSAVVYRMGTKSAWLSIPEPILDSPGPVSEIVAKLMAEKVLANTPEADISISITGHLGPAAPVELDGLVYIGASKRILTRRIPEQETVTKTCEQINLSTGSEVEGDSSDRHQTMVLGYRLPAEADAHQIAPFKHGCESWRECRQWLAVELALKATRATLHGEDIKNVCLE